jgi:hypothetical protein
MKTIPTPTQRERQLRRQQREREAHHLIVSLAGLRSYWRTEDCTAAAFDVLVEQWHEIAVTEADIVALRDWPQLPLTLAGLLSNLSQNIEDAWSAAL